MNIVVLNGSPKGQYSITLQTMLYIRKHFPEHEYHLLHVGQKIRSMEDKQEEWKTALINADLIVFCYPVYTFLVPAQLHRFIELMKESGVDVSGKYATQISTSKHFYDVTAHQFIQDNCADLGLSYIRGLSADMEDLLGEKGRNEAISFFQYVLWNIDHGFHEPENVNHDFFIPAVVHTNVEPFPEGQIFGRRLIVVADFSQTENHRLHDMYQRLKSRLPMLLDFVDIQDFPFTGGCLGCFNCASKGECVYKDGFDSFLRDRIQSADGIIYAYTIKDHSMGSRFKMFDDRQFCNGHRTVTMGKPTGYLVDGDLRNEANLRLLMEARAQVGGNTLSGIASNQGDPDAEIDRLAASICYDLEQNYQQPKNFYGVGGLKIFRDLIWQMQGIMQADHRFFRKHGFYDFPQKTRGSMLAMYLVGFLMRSRMRDKLSSKITEGMLMPYRKVLEEN